MRFAYLDESQTSDGRIYMFGILLVDEHQLISIERSLDSQASLAHGLRVKMCVWLGVSRGLDLAFLNAD